MTKLIHAPLTTLTLSVDFAGIQSIGATPAGLRRIAKVTGGTFVGERLSGTVLPGGQDWIVARPDGVIVLDVRLTLESSDGALLYLSYGGRFIVGPEAMTRFAGGELLDPADYSIAVVARFECGAAQHAWLNDTIVVGTGRQTPTGPVYSLFTVG